FGRRPLGMRRVGGVDPDQVDEQVGDLVLRSQGRRRRGAHACVPTSQRANAGQTRRPPRRPLSRTNAATPSARTTTTDTRSRAPLFGSTRCMRSRPPWGLLCFEVVGWPVGLVWCEVCGALEDRPAGCCPNAPCGGGADVLRL